MMRCDRHKKEYLGGCMWCGKRLCELCVSKRDGSKIYCEKCVISLGGVARESLPLAERSDEVIPSGGRRFVFKKGYLELQGGQ